MENRIKITPPQKKSRKTRPNSSIRHQETRETILLEIVFHKRYVIIYNLSKDFQPFKGNIS